MGEAPPPGSIWGGQGRAQGPHEAAAGCPWCWCFPQQHRAGGPAAAEGFEGKASARLRDPNPSTRPAPKQRDPAPAPKGAKGPSPAGHQPASISTPLFSEGKYKGKIHSVAITAVNSSSPVFPPLGELREDETYLGGEPSSGWLQQSWSCLVGSAGGFGEHSPYTPTLTALGSLQHHPPACRRAAFQGCLMSNRDQVLQEELRSYLRAPHLLTPVRHQSHPITSQRINLGNATYSEKAELQAKR